MIEVGLLGPVTLSVDGRGIALAGTRRRALVAVLAASRSPVPFDRLTDAVWSDGAAPPARNTVQVHVHQLRQAIAPRSPALRHTPAGYRLDDAVVDVRLVEDGLRAARAAERAGDLVGASSSLRAALGRFRGEFCADLPEHAYFRAARTFYETLRLDAHEAAVAVDLRLGRGGLVGELEGLLERHPLRERLWGQLMVALYRDGRQADALATFRRARAVLAEEAGVDPGRALRRIERAVLDQAGTASLLHLVAPAGAAPGRPVLTWLDGTGTARTLRLPLDGRLEIGRDPAAEVPLTWDAAASRRHAEIVVEAGRAVVVDHGSRNGTFHNGERLGSAARELRPGDLLRCGATMLLLSAAVIGRAADPAADTA
jgi:DNA-binding SARP family transcriptional activator